MSFSSVLAFHGQHAFALGTLSQFAPRRRRLATPPSGLPGDAWWRFL